jgi:hypothetical protein
MFTPLAFFCSGLPEDLPEYRLLFWPPEQQVQNSIILVVYI